MIEQHMTQCVVYDKTPDSDQKKINIVVRPLYTVEKVFKDITTQFLYEAFDLILQPSTDEDLVYLNDCQSSLIYDIEGFDPSIKNVLILLPPGEWDGNVRQRYDLILSPSKSISNGTITSSCGINYHNSFVNNNNSIVASNELDNNTSTSPNNARMATVTNTIHVASTTEPLNMSPMSDSDQLSDDDLALGASASPTEAEPMNIGGLSFGHSSPNSSRSKLKDIFQITNVPFDSNYEPISSDKTFLPALPSTTTVTSQTPSYVGLVNQAMTCYLNSLLQALFMTPEFRNALYRWEFDNDNEAKSIPYQLQKLFLNLQTSKKSAVETTDLTRSFGWDSTEAWQQHDIQELCRVMFDALEHKFKNTKQANLISNLYEGKMIDYVKCLECNTEKTRADTFLDIPLPVRPFGSTNAYGSIEEALRAFVQPETLDGNNQYFCEKCNKKCDAHKGLKFKNFPYILTLHLKRFDFDYQTMYRIKLNDKVTFPQNLNLNSFVNATDVQTFTNMQSNCNASTPNGHLVNGISTTNDDCSTTGSSSAMEEDNCSSGIATTASSSQHENDMNDDDEGIDMSTSTYQQQRLKSQHESGPYIYELFAIMIHSGSASGGHYYAYIKEFENNEWFCFNDQLVSTITQEDIQKSFGGASSKAYYTNTYSSSTNAYMLMYRQIDPKRNEHSMKVEEFPEHISTLLPKLHVEEETRVSRSGRHNAVTDLALPELFKPRVYFYNPELKKLKLTRFYVSRNLEPSSIKTVLETAHQMLNVEQFAPLSHCRLVAYEQATESILQSFENVSESTLSELRSGNLDFLLEYRVDGQEFEVYAPGGNTWHVYQVNLNTMEMDGPFFVYSLAHEKGPLLRHSIAVRLHIKENELLVATVSHYKAFIAYDPAPTKEAEDNFQTIAKQRFRGITYFYMNVPSTDATSLEILGIPAFKIQAPQIEVSTDEVDAVLMNGTSSQPSSSTIGDSIVHAPDYIRRESPLPPNIITGHESNSEDSSLSDGDRTLVESILNRCTVIPASAPYSVDSGGCASAGGGGGDSQVSSSSHSPQLSSPEDEAAQDSLNRIHAFFNSSNHHIDNDITLNNGISLFFHAIKINSIENTNGTLSNNNKQQESSTSDVIDDINRKPAHSYKILVDSHMKMGVFKQHIESLIRVPTNYFQIQRKHDTSDPITATNSLIYLTEGETLLIEFGKVLQPDEHRAKIFYMRLSELNNDTGKLPCICEWIYTSTMTVKETKKELIAKLHRIDEKFKTLTMENCRLWLKGGRNPIRILGEEEPLSNYMRSSLLLELLIQECENGVTPQPSEDSLTIFVRRWYTDKLQLGSFQEITLYKDMEIRKCLSEITDIPEDHIGYTKVNSSFPCTNISLLTINNSMSWFSMPATMDKYPLTTTLNGFVFYYKDITKESKELTIEERRYLNVKEKIRLDRLGCISTSSQSPRRERALKIYVESPQNKATATSPIDASGVKLDD